MESLTNDIKYSEARNLPIVTGFPQKLRIVEEMDRLFDGQMEFSPGRVVLGLILDTLLGRTLLFRTYFLLMIKINLRSSDCYPECRT